MNRRRFTIENETANGTVRRATVAAAAVLGLVLGACSTEDVAERVAEKAIEQQLEDEGGGDVDLDLGDGQVRIEGEDGEEVVVDIDEDGEGNVSIQGSGSQGDVEMSFGDDGVSVISTPEGEFRTGTELPDDFPAGVPVPDGMTIESAATMSGADGTTFVINGTVAGDFAGATDAYASALEAAGFAQVSMTETSDSTFFSFGDDEWDVAGGFYPATSGEGTTFGINIVPKAP
jgi:hypothetical protein